MEQYSAQQLLGNKQPYEYKNCGIPDWSTVHSDTGSLGSGPNSEEEWNSFKLTDRELNEFNRSGYIANKEVLTAKQCDAILSEYEKILALHSDSPEMSLFYEYHRNQSNDPDNVLMHALGHWRVSRLFHDLIFHPKVAVAASQLLAGVGEELCKVRFWHDQLFAKPAKHGGVVAWHQDYSYWTRTVPMRHLTVHIALEDQTLENGCIHYIPGSHNWTRDGEPLPVTDFNFGDMESIKKNDTIQTILNEEEKANFKPKPCLLKKGEVAIHHPLTVHGSYQNRSDNPRRAAVLNYFADGVKSNTDELLLDGTFKIGKGKRMDGQFYPIVFDPLSMT